MPLTLVVLLAACGSGAEKAAFERYEKAVEGVLEEDARLRAEFDEQVKDLTVLDQREGFEKLVARMAPFYERMQARVKEVEPEGKALVGIHALLLRYVELRREVFSTYEALDRLSSEVEEAEGPANEAVERATEAVQEKADVLNPMLRKSPALVGHLRDLISEESALAQALYENLTRMRQGSVRAEDFEKLARERVLPFYDRAAERLSGINDLAEDVVKGVAACRAYFGARKKLVQAALDLAEVRKAAEGDLVSLQERFSAAQDEAESALETYKRAAKEYRDGLR